MLKRILSMACAAVIAIVACGCSGISGGTLKVGVRSDIINFGYYNETAEKYYGLEIDIANELAERLGYKDVEFVTVKPETRKEMLLDGEVDCLIATYTISDTRTENFDFSDPYYTDDMCVMVEKSTLIDDIEQLKGKNIGTMSGANAAPIFAKKMKAMGIISETPENALDEVTKYKNLTITQLPSYEELDKALEDGSVDAACLDKCIAQTYINDDRKLLDTVILQQEYGVATQKGSELSEKVDKAIKEMLEDGTIDELIDKWN